MATEYFRKLISGTSHGLVSYLMRTGLSLLSFGYGTGVLIRNGLYAAGLKRVVSPDVPTVAVGNLTTGGTGKTPVVAFLANWFSASGITPAILSRGYHSLEHGANDEKLVLDRLCPGVPHLQHPDRVASARMAVSQDSAQVLILDDAFQHRRIGRELNLCLIDAINPWGYGYLLPRGLLREPRTGLRRADLVILTRTDQIAKSELEKLIDEVHLWAPDAPLVLSRFIPTGWKTLTGETVSLNEFQHHPAIAFCGIGNPDGFRHSLETSVNSVEQFVTFPDHHHYSSAEIDALINATAVQNCSLLLTTLKDLVKLPSDAFPGVTVAALEIAFDVIEGEAELNSHLERIAAGIR